MPDWFPTFSHSFQITSHSFQSTSSWTNSAVRLHDTQTFDAAHQNYIQLLFITSTIERLYLNKKSVWQESYCGCHCRTLNLYMFADFRRDLEVYSEKYYYIAKTRTKWKITTALLCAPLLHLQRFWALWDCILANRSDRKLNTANIP